MTDIAGRTAFITGAGNGIGLGIARAFAAAGTKVGTALLDMGDRDAFAAVADRIEATLGPVSLVVNNAGVAGGAPATKLTYELWDWNFGINLLGPIAGVQTFLPRMIERGGGGHIVNTASAAGLAVSTGGVLYHTAKFGLVGLSEALRQELAPLGVGVSVLCPGPVATGIIARTRTMQPSVVKSMSGNQHAAAKKQSDYMSRLLDEGVSPDAVGEMVADAVRDDRLYIHTDRSMIALIDARCTALLDAMPAA